VHLRFLLLVSLVFSIVAHADEWKKDFPVTGTPQIRVDANDASIEVRTWDQQGVSARVVTEGWKIGQGQVRIRERQDGNSIEVTTHTPNNFAIFSFRRRWVHVELTVPRHADLDLHSGDGSITVSPVAGTLHLDSSDGHIEALGVDGVLKAKTSDGHIHVQGRFDSLDLHTGDGHIDAEVANGSRMTSSWNVSTSDGRVRLRLPANFSADMDARTGDGHISSDFPVTVSGNLNPSILRGKLNGGGQRLEIRTGDGSIAIEKD